MSESTSSSEFLLGIEEYLKFINELNKSEMIHVLSKALDSSEPEIESIKTYFQFLTTDIKNKNKNLADLLHGFYKISSNIQSLQLVLQYLNKILRDEGFEIEADLAKSFLRGLDKGNFIDIVSTAYMSMLDTQFPNDKIFRGLASYIKNNKEKNAIHDALSRSQMKSKIWLIEELAKIDTHYNNVAVMAGWFGQLKAIYEKKCTYAKMRIVEIDRAACETSDYIFNLSNLENYKVKSIFANISNLILHKNGYEWDVENFKEGTAYSEKFLPDLIINTSAEHMTEEWFNQIRFKEMESNPIVAIQSNNLFDIPEHINCVHSIDHMKKKFPMKEILYEGELQLKGYKRVMLIGRP
jgi:hypothetical protein